MSDVHRITESELQRELGVSKVTLWRWRKIGLPCLGPIGRGREMHYDARAAAQWLIAEGVGANVSAGDLGERVAELYRRVFSDEASVPTEVPPGGSASNVGAPGERISDKDPHGYYAARAAREQTQRQLLDLDLRERQGELIVASEVRATTFEIVRRTRDRMLGLPDRLAPRLAAETDVERAHRLMLAEIQAVLDELAQGFQHEM